jgi:uncharacterized membrane protein YfcA
MDEGLANALLLSLGLVVGFLGTIIGVGGGFIVGPTLLTFYKMSPGEVAGTSLVVVFLNALSGTLAYLQQRRVVVRTGVVMSAITIPGSVLGSLLTSYIGGGPFRVFFAALLTLAAIRMMRGARGAGTARETDSLGRNGSRQAAMLVPLSLLSGVISGFFGVGGGIIHVPVMVLMLGFPAHIATATSQFVLTFTSITGLATHAQLGNINPGLTLPVGLGALVGAQLGARFSRRLSSRNLELAFSFFLLAMSVNLLYQALV